MKRLACIGIVKPTLIYKDVKLHSLVKVINKLEKLEPVGSDFCDLLIFFFL